MKSEENKAQSIKKKTKITSKTEESQSQIDLLKNQLLWYKSFFDYSADAIFIVQPETWCILETNDISSSILGIPKEKLIGSIFPQFKKIYESHSTNSSPIVLSELRLNIANRQEIVLEASSRIVDINGQKLIQVLARDIAKQNELNDKLLLTDKLVLLGMLSSGVTHEIRNPLAAVNLNLQLLDRKISHDSPEYPFLQIAMQGIERISKIVEVSLSFSNITTPEIKKMNINSLFPATMELIAPTLRKKNIKVDIKLDDNLPLVSIDYNKIQQVLINLITNAFDAIKEKGNIKINTKFEPSQNQTQNDYVLISITDDGCGIYEEDISRIFNPFFSRKADGIGLGLAITQKILLQHNGIINIISKVDEGTTITVKLPVAK